MIRSAFLLIIFSLLLFPLSMTGEEIKNEITDVGLSLKNAETPAEKESRIFALHRKVLDENRIVELFRPEDVNALPVGIGKTIGGLSFVVVISDVEFTQEGAYANASMSMEFPGSGKRIALSAENVLIHQNGIDAAQLKPIRDYDISFGNDKFLTIKQQGTYVEWDCAGYKMTALQASLKFSRNILLPVDKNGELIDDPQSRVNANFTTTFVDFNDLLVDINLSRFQVNRLEGFVFETQTATLDFSDIRNPASFVIPSGYTSPLMISPGSTLWRGVYIRKIKVILPRELNEGNSPELALFAENLILDEQGVTGKAGVENLLSLDKGYIAGWNFSLDKLSLDLMKNTPVGFHMNGQLVLPVSEEDKPLGYQAMLSTGGNFTFSIEVPGGYKMKALGGEMVLASNSTVTLKKVEGQLQARAVLHGKMTIKKENPDIHIPELEFQELTIQNENPQVSVKSFGVATNGSMAGMPINLKEVKMLFPTQKEIGIGVDMELNFMGENDGGMSANTRFVVWNEKVISGSTDSWKFKRLDVQKAEIDVNQDVFSFEGSLELFEEDETYGDGFRGMIHARFKPGLSVTASAQFGKVSGYRYWYVDAMASFSTGILISPGFAMYGFGGGAYYHMTQQAPEEANDMTEENTVNKPSDIPGKTPSNTVYYPNKNIGLGLKASVVIGSAPSPKSFNALATFKIEINSGGGISYLGFKGEAVFMADPGTEKTQVPLYAGMKIDYDVPNSTLYGEFEVYVNAGPVRGIHADNRAGTSIMYFGPDDWYIYMGTPGERIGIQFMNMVQADSYFMVGTQIPGMPEPPASVVNILGETTTGFMRDENALGLGRGFAFGSSIKMNTGEKTFLILYGQFAMDIGYDLMLKDYGSDAYCEGRTGALGLNGWYASGQLYSFLAAKLGVKVKLLGEVKKVALADLQTAALLQAKLPNPTYIRGMVAVKYNVLGGLVKGNCDFEFEIGEECELVGGSPLQGLEVIAELSPASGAFDVDVFSSPQVAFNMAIGQEFRIVDMNDQVKNYRIALDYFVVKNGNNPLEGNLEWNDDKNVVVFNGHEILPGKKQLEAEVAVYFEEKIGSRWQPLRVDGETLKEVQKISFQTAEEPDNIPQHNILYSYPIDRQLNFYKSEHNHGYIKLKSGQKNLFNPGSDWKQVLRFSSSSNIVETTFSYNENKTQINFSIPTTLRPQSIYKIAIVNVPVVENAQLDENVKQRIDNSTEGVEITTQDIEDNSEVKQLQEKEIYTSYFRTSKYNTFKAKVNNLQRSLDWSSIVLTGIHRFGVDFTGDETFDLYEISEYGKTNSLIKLQADLTHNTWYKDYIYPLVYKNLSALQDISITHRSDLNVLGVPPMKAIRSNQEPEGKRLTDEMIENDMYDSFMNFTGFIFDVSYYMYQDYMDLKNQAASVYADSNNAAAEALINGSYQSEFLYINYDFTLKYVLPGIQEVTSEVPLHFYYD